MKFGDMLVSKNLAPGDLERMQLMGNAIEGNSVFVQGIRSGTGNIKAAHIRGMMLDFRKVRKNYYYCFFGSDTSQSIPNDTPTDFTGSYYQAGNYNVGFPTNMTSPAIGISDGKFIFRQAGFYKIQANGAWRFNANGYRMITVRAFSGSFTGTFASYNVIPALRKSTLRGEIYVEKDSILMINVYQNSGVALRFEIPQMTIRLTST